MTCAAGVAYGICRPVNDTHHTLPHTPALPGGGQWSVAHTRRTRLPPTAHPTSSYFHALRFWHSTLSGSPCGYFYHTTVGWLLAVAPRAYCAAALPWRTAPRCLRFACAARNARARLPCRTFYAHRTHAAVAFRISLPRHDAASALRRLPLPRLPADTPRKPFLPCHAWPTRLAFLPILFRLTPFLPAHLPVPYLPPAVIVVYALRLPA